MQADIKEEMHGEEDKIGKVVNQFHANWSADNVENRLFYRHPNISCLLM